MRNCEDGIVGIPCKFPRIAIDTHGVHSMVKHFDHCTIVVRDVDAKTFFGLLGFKEAMSVVIAGEPFASYMGVPGMEADHVTLVLENASPRTEIQLLRYRHPQERDHGFPLTKTGFHRWS